MKIENLGALRAFEVSLKNLPPSLQELEESPATIFMRMGAHLAHELLSPTFSQQDLPAAAGLQVFPTLIAELRSPIEPPKRVEK
jgi:hypothetical protein